MDQKSKNRNPISGNFLTEEPYFEGNVYGEYLLENPNTKSGRENPRGRNRGRGKDRGGRGRGGYLDHDESEVGGSSSSSYFDHDKTDGSKQSLTSNQGYNFMAELESYKACKSQERRQGNQDGTQGRARSVSSERSTSSFKSTSNTKHRSQEFNKQDGNRSGDTYPIEKWKQMVLNMALKLNTSNQETNTDCYFFYYATCSKDTSCPFRHEAAALKSRATCQYWREGKCYKQICTYRHMEMEHHQKRADTMCWFENQPGGCQKQNCSFKHKKDRYNQDGEYLEGEDDEQKLCVPNVPDGNVPTSAFAHQEGSNLKTNNPSMDKKVDNFLEMFRATLSSTSKVTGNNDESASQENSSLRTNVNRPLNKPDDKLEAGEILDDREQHLPSKSLLGAPPILGNKPNVEDGNGISKPLDPAIEVIRKRLMEPPGIEKRVEDFLAAIRFSIAPPRQQPGLRKSLADRLTFKNNKPQTLSLNEMKNRLNSLKNQQQQQQQFPGYFDQETDDRIMYEPDFMLQLQFCDMACVKPATLPKCLTRKSLPLQMIQKTAAMANQGRGRGLKGSNRDVGHGRGGVQLGSQVGWEKESETSASEVRAYSNGRGYGIKSCLDEEDHGDMSRGYGRGRGQGPTNSYNKGAPDEEGLTSSEASRGRGRGRGRGAPPNIDTAQDHSLPPPNSLGVEKHSNITEQHSNDDKPIDDKSSLPKSSEEKLSDIPDTKIADEKKPLLEMPQKAEDKNVLPVKDEIFSLIHSARLGKPTSNKDVKAEDVKPEDVKADLKPKDVKPDVKLEDVKLVDVKPGDVKPGDVKPGDVKSGDMKPGDVKPGDVKPGDLKQGDLKQGDLKQGDLKQGDVKQGDLKQGDLKQGDLKQGDLKQGDVKPEDVKPEDVKPEEVKLREVNPKDMKAKDVKAKDLKPKDMKPKDVKPKAVKSPDKIDGVEDRKGDILPKTVDDKIHLRLGPSQSEDPRDQWLEENRRNERLSWNSDESWYDERRDLKHGSPDKFLAQSSTGRTGSRRWSPVRGESYDYNHRTDSFRDRGVHDEYRHNYDQEWGPISGPSRDWRYNRSCDQDWGDERGIDPKWNEERSSSRIWDDRKRSPSRERGILGRSPSRERGILGPAPGDEEGILGAHPINYLDRFSERISAKKKDWDYNMDPESREWDPSERAKESLDDVGLRDQWNESYSQQQEWGPIADQMPRDWSPGRLSERELRNWGPGVVPESYRSSSRESRMGSRREYGNTSPGRGPDIRGKDLTPRWSPLREDSSRMRLDGRSPAIGSFTGDQPSPGRRLSRGRSPLPSSEIRNWSTTSKIERSPPPNISGRNPTSEASTPVSPYGQHKSKTNMAICVKNLPLWTDEQSLKNVLSFEYNKYGQVTRVDISGTATDRYAVVEFRKPHEAQEAVFDSRNKVIFGQNVMVSLFDGEPPLEESKVHIIKSDYDYNQLLVGYKGEEFEALRSTLEVHKKECQKYREQPSSHPQYSKEYHHFCIEKQSKILSLGGDPTQYDILPEWKAYWPRRLEELFAVSWQSMKKQCLGSLTSKKEMSSKKSSSSSKKNRRSPSPRSDKSSRRKHRSSHSKSHVSSSRHRDKSRSRRRRSSSRTSTESSSTPRRDRHTERHTDKRKKSRRKRERSSSSSSSSDERSESKNKTPRKKERKEFPGEDPMEDGEIRDDDLETNVSTLTSTKKIGKDTQKGNYQEFIKQRMSDVLGHVPESDINQSTKVKDTNEKSRKKKSKFPNEIYPYTTDGSPKVKSKLVPYEAEDDQEHTSNKRKNIAGGGALGALRAQYSEPSSSSATASGSHSTSDVAISPLKICGNIITIIDILSVADETVSSVAQPLKDLYKQAMDVQSNGADPTEVFKDGKAAVNLTSCKLAILAESGTISKSNRKLYQEAQENIDKLMKVDQHFVEGVNIERISKKTMDMNVSEAIQYIRKEMVYNNPTANVSEDKVMNLYMEIKKRHLMYLSA